MKPPKTYDLEFKKRAVELLRHSGKPMTRIARELGCSANALSDWKRKYDDPLAGGLSPDDATMIRVGFHDDPAHGDGGVFLVRDSSSGKDRAMPYAYARSFMNDALWIAKDGSP